MAAGLEWESPSMDGIVTVQPTATTPGLLLRPWTGQDIPAMVAAHRDPLMRRWLRHPITTAEQARQAIEARQADRRAGSGFSFAVLEVDADGMAGDPVGGVVIRGPGGKARSETSGRPDDVGERLVGREPSQLRGDQPVRARGEGRTRAPDVR